MNFRDNPPRRGVRPRPDNLPILGSQESGWLTLKIQVTVDRPASRVAEVQEPDRRRLGSGTPSMVYGIYRLVSRWRAQVRGYPFLDGRLE